MADISADVLGLVHRYRTPPKAVQLVQDSSILLMVGATGAGKDSLINYLVSDGGYEYFVSTTSREPRMNSGKLELEGVDYYFVDNDRLRELVTAGAFIELKEVHGDVYGTLSAEIQKAHDENLVAISDVDIQGVEVYKAISPDVVAVFIVPPSLEAWRERLQKRAGGKITDPEQRKIFLGRLHTAVKEFKAALARPSEYITFVVNDDLQSAAKRIDAIVRGDDNQQHDKAARVLAQQILDELVAELANTKA
jgi:guanylate kinase